MRWLWFLALIPVLASASGPDVKQQVDVAGDSVVGDSGLVLGLGRSSFDVDINQCMGSTAWDTILGGKQKLVINWVCLAEFYLKTGQPELAAMAICNTEMLTEFKDEAECEAAHDFFIEVAAAVAVVEDNWEEEEEWREEQMQLQQDYDERIAQLEQLVSRPRTTRVVEQQPLLTEDQKARLEEVLKK